MLRAQVLILLASIFLGVGLFTPCLTVIPGAGEWTGVLRVFRPDFTAPHSLSIAEGIVELFDYGHYLIGTLILVFSILFPLAKLGVLWTAAWNISHRDATKQLLLLVEKLGKYSMLDIFVIAILIIAIKGLPGGSTVNVEIGFYSFVLSVLLSLVLPTIVRREFAQSKAKG